MSMRVLLLADIHGRVDALRSILETEPADAIVCAGDLSDSVIYDDYGRHLRAVLTLLEDTPAPVVAIPGNTDPEIPCVKALRARGMNLHDATRRIDAVELVGYGGAVGRTEQPFDPDGATVAAHIRTRYAELSAPVRVAVVHQPPADCALDRISGGVHVGEPAVRRLFEELEFALGVTGHIHEARGTATVGGTTVVNPGAVMDGAYAVATGADGDFDIEFREID